jgi:hypothetical protein
VSDLKNPNKRKEALMIITLERLTELYQTGETAAKAIKIGDLFHGAYGSYLEKFGSFDDEMERSIFVSGYLSCLPQITVDENGIIVELEPIRK